MAFRVTENGLVDIGPTECEENQRQWVVDFEEVRRGHIRTMNRVRSGELPLSWEVLKTLAMTSPHFLLDWSFDYSETALAQKLSRHIVHRLKSTATNVTVGDLDALPFFDVIGDDFMVRAALEWSPRERFQIEKLHECNEDKVIKFIGELGSTDALFFDALTIALEFVADFDSKVINSLTNDVDSKVIVKPRLSRGKRPNKSIVYRRLAVRLFLHEMRSLGYDVGSNDATCSAQSACDAAFLALNTAKKYPPSVATLRQDWQQWRYKDT